MNGLVVFLLVVLFIVICIMVGLYIRNWSRRHQFFLEFGVPANSDTAILRQAIFLRLQNCKDNLKSLDSQLLTLRQGIDRLVSPPELVRRQGDIDKLYRQAKYVSGQIKRARHLVFLCLPAYDDPKSLLEGIDRSLEHNPLTS